MGRKKLLLLGGIRYLIPVIKAAHDLGYYVITADYLPDNIAHKFSDEFVNVNIIEKDAVLKLSEHKKIDGIMSFGVDPGVVTASYVAECLGLPFAVPYSSAVTLQNKNLFRKFLSDHGFNVPKSYSLSIEEVNNAYLSDICYPVIVKPVDSAGSKGVTRVNDSFSLLPAINYALSFSRSGKVIIESFIEKSGSSSDSDCFALDGRMAFLSTSSQLFDLDALGPYVPAAYSWPSTFSNRELSELSAEIERLFYLLNVTTGIFNIESRVGTDGKLYIMEVSPRGGGNRLAEMARFATGVDLITASIKAAMGVYIDPLEVATKPMNNWAEVILHANRNGIFRGLKLSTKLKHYLVEEDLWVKDGDQVRTFCGANDAIGTLVLKFDNKREMEDCMANLSYHINVEVS